MGCVEAAFPPLQAFLQHMVIYGAEGSLLKIKYKAMSLHFFDKPQLNSAQQQYPLF